MPGEVCLDRADVVIDVIWPVPLRRREAYKGAMVKGRDLYYLQITSHGFDPLRVRVKVDRKRGKKLELQMEVST